MKVHDLFLVLAIALLAMLQKASAFVPNSSQQKRGSERRPAFSTSTPGSGIENVMEDAAASPAGPSTTTATSMFALPPTTSALSSALSAYYEEDNDEEQLDVSYGVALVSCVLSLALGFGIGYGV
jgi:hypothetical protein